MRNVLAFRGSLFSLMVFLLSGSGLMGQKLTVEEVITRHLSAVGAGAVTRKTSNIQGRGKLQILVGGRAALTGPFLPAVPRQGVFLPAPLQHLRL